ILDFGTDGLITLEKIIEAKHPTLVIIDPMVAYIGGKLDIHRANETRSVLAKLADIAERHTCAIMAIRHLNKTGDRKAIYRGIGSIDFVGAARSVLLAGCDPDYPQKRGVVHIKSNLAPMGAAIGYELRDGAFCWTGKSDLTAARILSVEDSGEGKSARDKAADFLRDELADGPVEAKQVWRDSREAGLLEATLKRAKTQVGVIARRQNEAGGKRGGGRWTWELPDSVLGVQDVQGYQEGLIENVDTLEHARYKNDPLPKTVDTLEQPSPRPASGGWEADL
ncbi:MAG: AAA family ATPase, partial [Dehalococcoidia bacterium]|nr:AAA family ATPase [Dehalococcoidia bacterium]